MTTSLLVCLVERCNNILLRVHILYYNILFVVSALTDEGMVWSFGDNKAGKLGAGEIKGLPMYHIGTDSGRYSNIPVKTHVLEDLPMETKISCGKNHTLVYIP